MADGLKWSYTGGSTGVLYTDRRRFYLHPERTAELWGPIAPFWSFSAKLNSEETNDPDFKLFKHETKLIDDFKFYIGDSGVSGNYEAGTETSEFDIDDGSGGTADVGVRTGLLVEIRANDDTYKCVAIVTSYSSASGQSVKVTPLWVDGTKAIADNDVLYIMGSAEEEGGTSPEAWADELEIVWGACQIQKTPVEITGTLQKMTTLRGYSNELARLRVEKYNEHNIGKNRSFLYGVRYPGLTEAPTSFLTGSNSRIIRTTWGIVTLLRRHGTSNVNKFSRTYSSYGWDDFVDDMRLVYKYKNLKGVKYAFVGAGVQAFFSKTGDGLMGNSSWSYRLNPENVPSIFGFDVSTIKHPFGLLHIVYDPSLRGQYDDTMVIVDPEDISRVVFRNPEYQTNIQANDSDTIKDQYFSDEGLGISLIKRHSFFEFS